MSEPQRLTRWQYAEVRALCRQYEELRSQAALLLGPRGVSGVVLEWRPQCAVSHEV